MHRRLGARRLGIATVLLVVALPSAAWAGKAVVAGRQKLQFKVFVRPAKAGAKRVSLRLRMTYTSTKPGGLQPPYNNDKMIFLQAKGLALHGSAVPACAESKLLSVHGNPIRACLAASKVGFGTAVFNARPATATLINASIVIYNGTDDRGYAGFAKGSPALFLYITGPTGFVVHDVLHVVRTASGLEMIAVNSKPPKAGVHPGYYTLQSLDFTLAGSSSAPPYLTTPTTCKVGWAFSVTLTNWFHQPSVTARDTVPCTR